MPALPNVLARVSHRLRYRPADGEVSRELLSLYRELGVVIGTKVHRSSAQATAQTFANNATTTVNWDELSLSWRDPFGFYKASAPDRLVVPPGLGGTYDVGFNGSWTQNVTGVRSCILRTSLTGNNAIFSEGAPGATNGSCSQGGMTSLPLADGDGISVRVFQDSGIALNFTTTNLTPNMWLRRTGD